MKLQSLNWKFFRGPEVSDLELWIKATDAQIMAQQPGGLTQPLIRWFEAGAVEAIFYHYRGASLHEKGGVRPMDKSDGTRHQAWSRR
jgi:hypothetical protein